MRWFLLVVLICVWPLPLVGLDGSSVPVLRFVQLASWITVLVALEGAGGMVGVLFALLWGHAFVYGVLLYVVATFLVAQLRSRLPGRVGNGVLVAAVVGVVVWGVYARPYDSLFHHRDAHASLLELYR
jgi:hypothetical protein